MSAVLRHNVTTKGAGARPMLFAHGFGCDQSMWRHVAPHFEDTHKVIAFDHVGAGGSDASTYDPDKYATLNGYAADIVEIGEELGVRDGILVGHSVSAMIGALAHVARPEMSTTLVMVGPSPRYIDDTDYQGGFSAEDIEDLLASLEENPLAWSASMAPAIVGNPDRPQHGQELAESICRLDPNIAQGFARTTFMSDNRDDLPKITAKTLILQWRDDIIAAEQVGDYVH
ncbi:alpha/beta hydrolase [Rhodobacteraceae bacterium N5(2021)]|uniref:Alpha/beta hydrolase n=1 Tax=Gymnodinialimonas phycosphaerae TaxID=2841589 RepID=A0A975TTS3_9RHOB|nr:alpha/beta hydrolase [Gymnodinialimonas phycosphaerae]MBY4894494.1 alpha/beta hydrolase [Gymnodinialimonas phycosphaerae]